MDIIRRINWWNIAIISTIVLILFLILNCICHAQSMRRDSIRVECFEQLNTTSSGTEILTTVRMNHLINRSILDICNDFPALMKLDTVTASGTVERQGLNADFLRAQGVFRMIDDSLRIPLVRMKSRDTLAIMIKEKQIEDMTMAINNRFSPRYYWTVDTTLCFFPKFYAPGITYKFLIEYYAIAPVVTVDSVAISIKKQFREALIWNVCRKASSLRGNWSDATEYEKLYNSEIIKYREPVGEEKAR